MAAEASVQRRAIEAALLDYQRAPGRHAIANREPAAAFGAMREVLQLAGGRAPDEGGAPPSRAVVRAARLFLRVALLAPGADHYTLLGLEQDAAAPEIKERYRTLMRLMHPDFESPSAAEAWPSDAASRVNSAYDVLSSPQRRADYDAQLAAAPARPTAHPPAFEAGPDPQRRLKWLALAFGSMGAVAAAAWIVHGQPDREDLVQRQRTLDAVEPPAPARDTAPEVTTANPPPPAASEVAQASPEPAPAPAPAQLELVPEVAVAASKPASLVAMAAPAPAAALPVPTPAPVRVVPAPTLPPPVAPAALAARPSAAAAAPAPVTALVPAPALVPAASPTPAPPPSLPVAASPASASIATIAPVPVSHAAAPAAPTMADVHPLLARLLQHLESGWGDRLLGSLDREARREPAARALVQHYEALIDGARPVQVKQVDFEGKPHDGRLVVAGRVLLQVRDVQAPTRQLALQAEFAWHEGKPQLTRLAKGPE